jgi:hypothetical protein
VRFKTKLSANLICLIVAALLFETVFWLSINNLSETRKKEGSDASTSIEIVNKIDGISRRAVDIVTTCADPVQTPDPRINDENIEKLRFEFKSLSQLVKDLHVALHAGMTTQNPITSAFVCNTDGEFS